MADIDQEIAALKQETTDKLDAIIDDQTKPQPLRQAAFNILHEQSLQDLDEAVGQFNAGSKNFVVLLSKLATTVRELQQTPGVGTAPEFQGLLNRWTEVYGDLHADLGLPTTYPNTSDALQPPADEAAQQPSGDPAPVPGGGTTGVPLNAQRTLTSVDYPSLSDEYIRFFAGAGYRSAADRAAVGQLAAKAVANKAQYEAVGNPLGIPWWFIAGVHMLESGFSFTTHLHNGDPLSRRTTHVPVGQPETGMPPFTWVDSAKDALTSHHLNGQTDWSLSRALFRWEKYNGMGYRRRGVPSPYLWSFSTISAKGKFVRDGQYDPNAISKQCGVAVLLKFLNESGQVPLKLDYTGDTETTLPDADHPPPPELPAAGTDFAAFFADKLSGMRHFKAEDFLFKGASHATNRLNTDPPKELWPNIVKTARVLDDLREAIGKPIVLLSIYRSPAYNAAVGGVAGSQHKRFCACDFRVVGATDGPPQWAAKLKAMRAAGQFQGGVGIYPTFVHVDTRGWNTNWE